jgi:hypothetical protein
VLVITRTQQVTTIRQPTIIPKVAEKARTEAVPSGKHPRVSSIAKAHRLKAGKKQGWRETTLRNRLQRDR